MWTAADLGGGGFFLDSSLGGAEYNDGLLEASKRAGAAAEMGLQIEQSPSSRSLGCVRLRGWDGCFVLMAPKEERCGVLEKLRILPRAWISCLHGDERGRVDQIYSQGPFQPKFVCGASVRSWVGKGWLEITMEEKLGGQCTHILVETHLNE